MQMPTNKLTRALLPLSPCFLRSWLCLRRAPSSRIDFVIRPLEGVSPATPVLRFIYISSQSEPDKLNTFSTAFFLFVKLCAT